MAKTLKQTSITEARAQILLKNAPERKTLNCEFIPGFRLIKLKNGGAWQYRYTNTSGNRKVATIGSYKDYKPNDAAEIASEWRKTKADPLADKAAEDQHRIQAEQKAEHRTLRHYLDGRYFRHMERWKAENANENHKRIHKQFAQLMDRDLVSINKHDMDDWQREQEKRGLAYNTIQRDYGRLKTLLNTAVQEEVIDSNPIAKHKLLDASVEQQARLQEDSKKSERRMLTQEEKSLIHKGLDLFAEQKRQERRNSRKHGKGYLSDLDEVNYPHWFIPYAIVGLLTGLRPSDLRTLNWGHINFDIKPTLTKVCEKTKRKQLSRNSGKPTQVALPISGDLMNVLKKLHDDQCNPKSGLLFPSPKTDGVLDKQAGVKPWRQVKELGGLPNLPFYCFRHNFISAMLNNGDSIFTATKLAGHKDPSMIMNHYGEVSDSVAAKAMEMVSQSLEVKPETKSI